MSPLVVFIIIVQYFIVVHVIHFYGKKLTKASDTMQLSKTNQESAPAEFGGEYWVFV
jgi:hypothetical protein